MALIKCKDCGGDVSTDAKACPRCGAPPPPLIWTRQASQLVMFLLVMLAFLFVLAVLGGA